MPEASSVVCCTVTLQYSVLNIPLLAILFIAQLIMQRLCMGPLTPDELGVFTKILS